MQRHFLFNSMATFFGFLISHTYFRVSVDFVVHIFDAVYNHKICRFFDEKTAFLDKSTIGKRLTKPNILLKKDVKYLYNTLLIIRIFTTNLHLRHKYARNERLLYLFVSQFVTTMCRKLTSICQTF